MSTNIKILSSNEIKSFDLPPSGFSANERKQFFRPTKAISHTISSFRTPTTKVGFVLQFGYFKATNKFFKAKDFQQSEIEFVCRALNVSPSESDFNQYIETSLERHQQIIHNIRRGGAHSPTVASTNVGTYTSRSLKYWQEV